ncbi:AAA domain-containing protein [Actinomadura fibrosa]|uniref:AAA domain-containing protein n=1 Tax=Actinomadura fibrosa TaxID=111802 RepID=A0ABW2XMT6_9ACTN|nr:AAA domain-containing protein [Actinomadura fibrosa]
MNAPPVDGREQLLADCVRGWKADLTDLSGQNTLLYYKSSGAGTINVGEGDPEAVQRLLAAKPVRLSRLFPDEDDAVKRVRALYRKARELSEERGIAAAYMAIGIASWSEPDRVPAAPVLLRGLTLKPTRARQDDFELVLDEEVELNEVLLHKLATDFSVQADDAGLLGLLDGDTFDPTPVFERLKKITASSVPGFRITEWAVLGTFTYAKLPMVRDLERATELLAGNDVIAAIAGDPQAQDRLDGQLRTGEDLPSGDQLPPAEEFTVDDADSSQVRAIQAVRRGLNVVVHGPPGTGKTQTIANLIATLVAERKKVLFVAEKRAAIDAVLDRLRRVDLADLVLDIHGGTQDRRRIAAELGTTLERAGRTPPPQVGALHRRLAEQRAALIAHEAALHAVRQPWSVTAFEAQGILLRAPSEARSNLRFPEGVLRGLGEDAARRARDELRQYADLGGFAMRQESSAWYGAVVTSFQQVEEVQELINELRTRVLPTAATQFALVSREFGFRLSATTAAMVQAVDLLDAVRATSRDLLPEVYTAPLDHLIAATGPRRTRWERGSALGWRERWSLRRRARRLRIAPSGSRHDLHTALLAAERQLDEWRRLTDGPIRAYQDLDTARTARDALVAALNKLSRFLPTHPLFDYRLSDLTRLLDQLAAEQPVLWHLPTLYELRTSLHSLGLEPLLAEVTGRRADADLAAWSFDFVWYSSVLHHVQNEDRRWASWTSGTLDQEARHFAASDREHQRTNRERVRRATAEWLRESMDRAPQQARLIRRQAALQRRHLPLKSLVEQAGEVLLSLKPCWAMSPLMASQVLPREQIFDVVIFDEASQVIPADAVPSIMRGRRLVVAGDGRQLPPSNFFSQVSGYDHEDEAEQPAGIVSYARGFESILNALEPLLLNCPLTWHYRSRDERLIAFSNHWFYKGALTTFPGVQGEDCLRFVHASQTPGAGQDQSVTAEVHEVVDLALEHARTRPQESLGVIALGSRHAQRVDALLRQRLAEHPELEEFFAENGDEAFFVKNLERVQGDERDAIILTLGYGKHADGRMRYLWGPIMRPGGERRVNVAITRAKHRLTLVSSFTRHDVDPDRLHNEGGKMLCRYLEFAETRGQSLGYTAPDAPDLNPFEQDVHERLIAAGIPVIPQYGVAGYRIDFAAKHPAQPGRMVLAIEADGASYHSAPGARDRDRLRQQQLERLGWRFHRIWSTAWFRDPVTETTRARAAYDRAVAEADAPPRTGPHSTEARRQEPTPAMASHPKMLPRPAVQSGLPITEYAHRDLVRLVRWIESDGLLRTREQVLVETMAVLGFNRRGSRIVDAIDSAITDARRRH